MALSYASPGVYVEEVDRGTKPIEAVGTSMAAFVGITAEASLKAIDAATGERTVVESKLNKPTLSPAGRNSAKSLASSFREPSCRMQYMVTSAMAVVLAT
jgi:phage tail sheath protein FI